MRTVTRSNVTLPFLAVPPNGRSFLVAGGDQGGNIGKIMAYDVVTGEAREVYRARAGWVLRNLAISADGRLLAFSVADSNLQRNLIYSLPAAGGDPTEVVRLKEPIAREGLAWSPDGRCLWLVKTSGTKGELFRVPAGGGTPEAAGISERGLSLISVHPAGTRITYTIGQYFQIDIWALENFLPGPPYMHDGSRPALEEVVEHYDRGGNPNPQLDPEIRPLHLSAEEKRDLDAFLRALSGETSEGVVARPAK